MIKKTYKPAVGVAIGYVIGTIIGVGAGILTIDMALWLSIGVGVVLHLGLGLGLVEYLTINSNNIKRHITGGIFYCRDSAGFNVSASNILSCSLTGRCFEIGN
jgi:hypothetical protein